MTSAYQDGIMRLTKAAVQAAELGQWDTVIRCYSERGALLDSGVQVSTPETENILKLDGQVRDRIHTAQTVTASLLDEAATTRQRLQGLRQRLGVQYVAPETMSREA